MTCRLFVTNLLEPQAQRLAFKHFPHPSEELLKLPSRDFELQPISLIVKIQFDIAQAKRLLGLSW